MKRYSDRLKEYRAKTNAPDAIKLAAGPIEGVDVVVAVQDFEFLGGSLGMAAGEAIITGMIAAIDRRVPFIIFTASGGARMQEGMFSLMQMPRTTLLVQRLRAAKLPYIVVLTNPTTGGVTASYAMLGDVHLAEPGAVIGFAGARVIEQTIRERLPPGFQRAEYLQKHGMVDMVVARKDMRATLSTLCGVLMKQPESGGVKQRLAQKSDAILERLTALHPKKIDLSLGRIEALLDKLGRPQDRLPPVIHVAGTNGKGSTIAFLRAMLEAAGKRVHVYTSPHLVRFHERIRLAASGGGRLVDEAELAATLERCEQVNDGAPITFFEMTTAAALVLFAAAPADVLLLEVGLGGRYDATNVVAKPAASVVTAVSMDHVEFLGSSLEGIAGEKAGIFKRGCPAIVAAQTAVPEAVLEREAARAGAPLILAGRDFFVREEHGRLLFEDDEGLIDLPLPRLSGRHQHQNAAAAIATLRRVAPDVATDAIERGLQTADWPARLQRLSRGKLAEAAPLGAELWLDGGHNEDGGRVLGQAMADLEEKAARPLVVICGTLTTKDTKAFLHAFAGLAQEVIAVPVKGEHAGRPARDVASCAEAVGVPAAACQSVGQALAFLKARTWSVPPRILVCGSLYLAGAVLAENGTPPA